MKFLFFFVHPSKYYLFRETINTLRANGHHIDIFITKKDVLESLIKKEDWKYRNIFPEGRKIESLPVYFGAGINLVRTIYRLIKYINVKKYDLYITDDLLVLLSKIKKVKSILFTDDHLYAIPESVLLVRFASHVLCPDGTNLGKYSHKKIGFSGYKQSAYLHPSFFMPNNKIRSKLIKTDERYFIIRVVNLKSTHDYKKSGINNKILGNLIDLLSEYGKVFINSERELPKKFNKFLLPIHPSEVLSAIFYADLFVGDSQTMCAEAGYLGTPFIWYSHFFGKVFYLDEMINKYKLGYGIELGNEKKLFSVMEKIVSHSNYKNENLKRRDTLLKEKINLSNFMIWLFENYPKSIDKIKKNPDFQFNFK